MLQARQQRLAAALRQKTPKVGALDCYPADRTGGEHIDNLPVRRHWLHNVVEFRGLAAVRCDAAMHDQSTGIKATRAG